MQAARNLCNRRNAGEESRSLTLSGSGSKPLPPKIKHMRQSASRGVTNKDVTPYYLYTHPRI